MEPSELPKIMPKIMGPRERALATCLRWLSLAVLPIWATLLGQVIWEEVDLPLVLRLIAITSFLPLLYALRERLSFALTIKLCVSVLVLTTAYVEMIVGFTPTTALMSMFSLLIAMLLLGDRAFPIVLGASLMTLGLGWLSYSPDDLPKNASRLLSTDSSWVWLRHAFALGFFGAALRDWARNARSLGYEELLNELGGVLASSLDAKQTLREVSRRVVLHLADFCLVDLYEKGRLKEAWAASRDPAAVPLADALAGLSPFSHGPNQGSSASWTGAPELAKVTPEYLKTRSQSADQLALFERLGARSIMSVPMITSRDVLLGSLTAVSTHRVYDRHDLRLLIEVGQRAAMAIENATLYADLRCAHDEIGAQLRSLEQAHERIRTLTGLLPICAWCGRIRDEQGDGQWRRFDEFVTRHTSVQVTHGICPECARRFETSSRVEKSKTP